MIFSMLTIILNLAAKSNKLLRVASQNMSDFIARFLYSYKSMLFTFTAIVYENVSLFDHTVSNSKQSLRHKR